MRQLLLLVLLAAGLVTQAAPAQAQATADQLNKLSLEALTAPPPPGSGGGYGRRAPRSYGYRPARPSYARRAPSYRRPSYGRPSYRRPSYRRPSYHRPSYRRPSYRPAHRYTPRQAPARLAAPHRPAPRAYHRPRRY